MLFEKCTEVKFGKWFSYFLSSVNANPIGLGGVCR